MMGTETVPETLDFNELTRLSAWEEFINNALSDWFCFVPVYDVPLNHESKTFYFPLFIILARLKWSAWMFCPAD
jgi:hypothetical protein